MPRGVYPRIEEHKQHQSVANRKFHREHPNAQKECHSTPGARANLRDAARKRKPPSKETKVILSAAHIGVSLSEEHKANIGISMMGKNKGEKNGMWQGGISNFPYPFEFNAEFRELVRERYCHTCMICKLTQEQIGHTLNIHHIDYDKNNLNSDNFLPLCNSCHGVTKVKKNRTYWTKVLRNVVETNKMSILV